MLYFNHKKQSKTNKTTEILAAAGLTGVVSDGAIQMNFVDTKFWTDTYEEKGKQSIYYTYANVPSYKGKAEKVTLKANDRESAEAFIMWEKDYLFVLLDITDPDIAPESAEYYDTDSTEFFLDEDNSKTTTYGGDEDAVQLRVGAINNIFSSNETGINKLKLVAHAVNIKKDGATVTVYQVQYIIKLTKEHKAEDVLGMDIQINDCFTVQTPVTDDNGAETGEYTSTPDRAGTLTAFDTTNEAYQNPSKFGRVKLIDVAAK